MPGFRVMDWRDPLVKAPWNKAYAKKESYVVSDFLHIFYADDTGTHIAAGKGGEVMSYMVKCGARLGIEMHVAKPVLIKGVYKSKSQCLVLPAGGREVSARERQPFFLEGGGVLPNTTGYRHLGVWIDEPQSNNA